MHKQPKVTIKFIVIKSITKLTNNCRQVLEDMEMLSAFTAILHVPNLSSPDHVLAVLEDTDLFNKAELQTIAKKMHGKRYRIKKLFCLNI